MKMKIANIVGHSILKNGRITSADGIINEYEYNKKMVPYVSKYIKAVCPDWDVVTIICPEKKFLFSTQERLYKLGLINGNKYDEIHEYHLNSYNGSAKGSESLYKSSSGKRLADADQRKMKTVFVDRGSKLRNNLYILNGTDCPAVLHESFFCDNKGDVSIGEDYKEIARLHAEAITGKSIAKNILDKKTSKKKKYGTIATKNDPLRMRYAANSTARVIQTIKKGEKVEIVSKGKSWHKCKYNGFTGYCSAKYIKLL